MSNDRSLVRPLIDALLPLAGRLARTEGAGRLANFPPIAWALRGVSSAFLRLAGPLNGQVVAEDRVSGATLQDALDGIVRDVVESLGYLGAMVATYEKGDELAIRAVWFDPTVVTMERIREWERQVSQLTPNGPVSMTDPHVARVKIYDEAYAQNLSVLAARSGRPVVRDDLYSLFTPVAPPAAKPIIAGIQAALGVTQVIAVPFFLRTSQDADEQPEMVGNLFALKRGPISESDIRTLAAFGRRAAEAILNEHLKSQIKYVQELVYEIQKHLQDEEQILNMIVEGVVEKFGYVAAMVATYESNGALPLRAVYVDPALASLEQIQAWEQQVTQFSPDRPLSFTNPRVARVYLDRDEDAVNLSVIAARCGEPQMRDDIYSLLAPVVPPAAKPLIDAIQQKVGVYQVIAVPFFLESLSNRPEERTLVGNLFALTRSRHFTRSEIELLQLFGQQAAVGLRNAQMYRRSEHRRQTSEIFGKMAFSAAASIHALRNHVGGAKTTLQLLQMFERQTQDDLSPPERTEIERLRQDTFAQIPAALDRLNQTVQLLDTLHEPWRLIRNVPTDVNACLARGLARVLPIRDDWVHMALDPELPPIYTVSDMLTETFKVLIKNAVEAIESRYISARTWPDQGSDSLPEPRELRIESRREDDTWIIVTIHDNGTGIRPEHVNDIFEMGWTTKETGLGFGLFWTKDYLEGLGGSIQVESVWQCGTTFRVRLPVRRPPTPAELPSANAAAGDWAI
jgi:signal transduction histidine kinase